MDVCDLSCVTCHISCVTCHVSRVTCHMSCVTCHFFCFFLFDKVVKLVVGGSVINGATPSSFNEGRVLVNNVWGLKRVPRDNRNKIKATCCSQNSLYCVLIEHKSRIFVCGQMITILQFFRGGGSPLMTTNDYIGERVSHNTQKR